MLKKFGFVLIVLIFAVAAGCSKSSEYPSRSVEMIVPWSPGGGSDTAMRVTTKYLEQELDVSVPVINKPGIGGTVGLKELSLEKPTGYNVGMIHEGQVVSYHAGVTDINYDAFDLISAMTSTPQTLVVNSKLGINTLEEFIEYGKNNEIKYGATLKGLPHAYGLIFEDSFDIKLKYVSYEGTSQRVQALAGGFIDAIVGDVSSVDQFVETGDLKIIAAFTEERIELLPHVPTAKESGYDLLYSIRRGILAPKGMEPGQIKALEAALKKVAANPGFVSELSKLGIAVDYLDSAAYQSVLKGTDDSIRKIASKLKN